VIAAAAVGILGLATFFLLAVWGSVYLAETARLRAAGPRRYTFGFREAEDSNLPNHYIRAHFLGQELEMMVESNMTPTDAIVAATANAADNLGRTNLGTIERGKRADLIAIDGDPTQDIASTRSVTLVVQGGVVKVNGLSGRQD
jgi:adenine deaminase